jgi:hypothetical protein
MPCGAQDAMEEYDRFDAYLADYLRGYCVTS